MIRRRTNQRERDWEAYQNPFSLPLLLLFSPTREREAEKVRGYGTKLSVFNLKTIGNDLLLLDK